MELLRRALLVGCVLPALWLSRLAPLGQLISIVRVDPAAQQKQSLPGGPSFVSGEEWDLFLLHIDALEEGLGPEDRWRVSADLPEWGGTARWVFYRPDEKPIATLFDKVAIGDGTTFVSISRRDGEFRYRVDRREFTQQEFRPGAGFTGKPVPPSLLLYPFQNVAYAVFLVGVALFILIPSPTAARGGLSPLDFALLVIALLLFAGPLFATGGSVQALTRGLPLTLPCWLLAAPAVHFFAKPGRNAPHPLFPPTSDVVRVAAGHLPTFLRWGLVMLVVAIGPLAALVGASMHLWNR